MTIKTCMKCNQKITLVENQLGLVFEDEHFLCESCNKKHTNEEINKLTKTIMQSPQNGMPIALWLVHEQNKNKTIMSGRKRQYVFKLFLIANDQCKKYL